MRQLKKKIHKHFKNINTDTIKKVSVTLALLLFTMAMLFQKDQGSAELQFVWNVDETFIHNAANTQRDYLFEDEGGQDIYEGQLNSGNEQTTQTETIDTMIDPNEVQELIGDTTGTGIMTYSGEISTGQTIIPGNITTGTRDCITPRQETIKHGDFVLAYQQRNDVNTICNVEKRICNDSILKGSFEQRSCKENVIYNYTKAEVISYNQKTLNEYIQPSKPVNAGAEFDTQGKINTTTSPIDTRGERNSPVETQTAVNQTTTPTKKSCTTPRGQTIKNGQFIKAYKTQRGFIDLPCEVQIRPCINGNLKGTYNYNGCIHYNTTYADYLTAGSPSSHTGFLFFERIKKTVRFGR